MKNKILFINACVRADDTMYETNEKIKGAK